MTSEEMITTLKLMQGQIEWDYPMDYAVAIDGAIEALKKQIPKKAVGEHYAHMRCPSCNRRIPSGAGSSSRRRDNWCNYCGQAIDWKKGEG